MPWIRKMKTILLENLKMKTMQCSLLVTQCQEMTEKKNLKQLTKKQSTKKTKLRKNWINSILMKTLVLLLDSSKLKKCNRRLKKLLLPILAVMRNRSRLRRNSRKLVGRRKRQRRRLSLSQRLRRHLLKLRPRNQLRKMILQLQILRPCLLFLQVQHSKHQIPKTLKTSNYLKKSP